MHRLSWLVTRNVQTLNDEFDGERGFSELVLERHRVVAGVLLGHLAHGQRRHSGHGLVAEPSRVRQISTLVLPLHVRLRTR